MLGLKLRKMSKDWVDGACRNIDHIPKMIHCLSFLDVESLLPLNVKVRSSPNGLTASLKCFDFRNRQKIEKSLKPFSRPRYKTACF
jgi:hypothetical protein